MVAEQDGRLTGYLRAWWRHFGPDDAQLMWLPADHLTSQVFFQFASAAGADPGAVFATLFAALAAVVPAPHGEPWALSLVPPVAGLDATLAALGFRATSIFGYRPLAPLPEPAPLPPGLQIRPARRADAHAITQLYADLSAYHSRNDPTSDRDPPRLWEEFGDVLRSVFLEPRRWVLLVAGAGDDPAPLAFSLASVDTEEGGPALVTQLPPGRVGFIHDFMIDESLRRRGLGRALWAATHEALAARGSLHGTWVIYRTSNPTGARFWPALGYVPLYTMWRRGGWAR
ncbi:MAG TPA: GNAT family N-acetyltransferase [Chloroflexia bacterium]|nr:GNAT family N-acetyltransferase [Chloroflexia bacterium]